MYILTIILSALLAAPSLVIANVALPWYLYGSGFDFADNVHFFWNLRKSPNHRQYFYAMQYYFNGTTSTGKATAYCGLQPQDAPSTIRAVFSSFIAGTTSHHPNCSNGADGGAGVSCGLVFTGGYDYKYQIVVKRIGKGNTIEGRVKEEKQGIDLVIGNWTLPAASDTVQVTIQTYGVGFLERYVSWDGNCSHYPYGAVEAIDPFIDGDDNYRHLGYIDTPIDYGVCKGKNNVKYQRLDGDDDGWFVQEGFPAYQN